MQVKILVADPNYLVRQGLHAIFDHTDRYKMSGETDDYSKVKGLIESNDPAIVVMGINSSEGDLRPIIKELLASFPDKKFLVIDHINDKNQVIELLQLGVQGYILRHCDEQEIIDALDAMMADKSFFCSNVLQVNEDAENGIRGKLTEREMEILKLISNGMTDKEIAEASNISDHTVATHRKNLMRKFRAKNNVDLVISAVKESVITP